MREPILPPPPPIRVAVWAVLNALWFRTAAAVRARIAAVRSTRRAHRPARRLHGGACAPARPLPQAPRALLAREERPTVVAVRRAG